jgi:hypothetical protein
MEDLLKQKSALEHKLAELQRRIDTAAEVAIAQREALYLEHIDALMAMIPDHSRTSCSDVNPCNADRHCYRCNLLHLEEFRVMKTPFKLWLSFE